MIPHPLTEEKRKYILSFTEEDPLLMAFSEGQRFERQRVLDSIWEWMEIGVECEKPNPVISQLIQEVIRLRGDHP